MSSLKLQYYLKTFQEFIWFHVCQLFWREANMSGRGRPPGSFRNQRGFQGVRGNSSPTSPSLKKSRASVRNDTFTGGGSPSTRSATSPSIRTRSLTPASENNVVRSSGKFRNTIVGSNSSGGRVSLGRVGKNNTESKSSSPSTAPIYQRQTSSTSSSSRSGSPESRKRKMETSTNTVKKVRSLSEKRLTNKPKFQDNPSAPEIVDCNQTNKEHFEADLNISYEGSNDNFITTTDKSSASGGSDDDSDTDNESNATEPIVDNNIPSIEENDVVITSTIDEDSLVENEKESTTLIEQESINEDESISSISDIMSDAACAFFNESSLNRDSNEENDINPANESSSKQLSNDGSHRTMTSPYYHQPELRNEGITNDLSKYINGKLVASTNIILSSKMKLKKDAKSKRMVSSLVHNIISVSKTFGGKHLMGPFHPLEFVEQLMNKFFSEYSSSFLPDVDDGSNKNTDDNLPTSNGNMLEKDFKIEVSNEFMKTLSNFVSNELSQAFMLKEASYERSQTTTDQSFADGATHTSENSEKAISNDIVLTRKDIHSEVTIHKELSNGQMSEGDCLVLQEIDAANAVSAVTGPEAIHVDNNVLDIVAKEETLDKSKLITEMEGKFAKDTNSALKKRPVYKKHGTLDFSNSNGQKTDKTIEQQPSKLISKSAIAPDSMILRMKEPGEVEVCGNKKGVLNSLISDGHTQKLLALTPPQTITNGSQEEFTSWKAETQDSLERQCSERSDSTNNESSGTLKALRKVRVKRGKDKADDENRCDISKDVFIISDSSENTSSFISDVAAKNLAYNGNHDSYQTPQQSITKSPLSPGGRFQISPGKTNQGPRRYYEKKLENNFILAPRILSKADAENSTVALFKTPSILPFNSQLSLDPPEESDEAQHEKDVDNVHVETPQSSLKTVIRLPKIGSKKKGKRRFAEEESTENPEDTSLLPSQEKRKKTKHSQLSQPLEQHISIDPDPFALDEADFRDESPSPEPQKFNRTSAEECTNLTDEQNTFQDTQKNNNDDKLQG